MLKIISVVGARPNFMKVAPLHRAFTESGRIDSLIVHTGQHYDARMSDIFFNQLGLPTPHYHLGVGGGSHAYQKAHVMLKFEEVLLREQPDLVLVVGDVNATVATTLVAVKLNVPVAHVEAGLRSGDRKMPEEVNRVITDAICQYHFVTEQSGLDNLKKESALSRGIHLVGNVMIDSLVHYQRQSRELGLLSQLRVKSDGYILVTMHRPANVDGVVGLTAVRQILLAAGDRLPLLLPLHPRTRKNMETHGLLADLEAHPAIVLLEPQGYLEFLHLMENARLILTDSGGIQEEATYLRVPCLTFRDTTERPVTVQLGTNILLADLDPETTIAEVDKILGGEVKTGSIPPLWDGHAAERIRDILLADLSRTSEPAA